jgi:Ni/Co efflux regulator RcnB
VLSAAFGSRKKKRLNRVFDAIGFMYPYYRYPSRGHKRKSATSGKDVASAAPSEAAPKRKKVKVLIHRPRYIEPAIVPEFGGETSSATEAKEPALSQRIEEPAAKPKASSVKLAESRADIIEETAVKGTRVLEVTSPSAEVTVLKAQKDLRATPKRKRMVNVLDALETIKTSSTLRKIAETPKTQSETRLTIAEAAKSQVETEAGPSEPTKEKSMEIGEKETAKEATEQTLPEKTATPTPETEKEVLDYFVRHASGKRLSDEEKQEAQYYARKLKYPKGALIFNGNGQEDFLYCLPDSKEIYVCREISRSFGFPTLEDGLSVLSKDKLDDNLAYNSLKV